MSTHYETLNITPRATLQEVKAAYRKTQLRNHPDKTRNLPENERTYRERIAKAANVAYGILSIPAQRTMYDAELAAAAPCIQREMFPQKRKRERGCKEDGDELYDNVAETESRFAKKQKMDDAGEGEPREYLNSRTIGIWMPDNDWHFQVTVSKRYHIFKYSTKLKNKHVLHTGVSIGFELHRNDEWEKNRQAEEQQRQQEKKDNVEAAEEHEEHAIYIKVLKSPGNRQLTDVHCYLKHANTGSTNPIIDVCITLKCDKKADPILPNTNFLFSFNPETSHTVPISSMYAATHLMYSRKQPPPHIRGRKHPQKGEAFPIATPEWRISKEFGDCAFLRLATGQGGGREKFCERVESAGIGWWRLCAVGYELEPTVRSWRRMG